MRRGEGRAVRDARDVLRPRDTRRLCHGWRTPPFPARLRPSIPRSVPDHVTPSARGATPARRPWTFPELVQLPPLQQLTLQTGGIGGSCTPSSGCTFSFLAIGDDGVRVV